MLQTLTQACEKTGWQVHAYCLVRNHFHLVLETPRPNLVEGMKWGIPKDSPAGRRVFGERMEWRRGEKSVKEFKPVERGWCLGGEEFRRELLEQVNTLRGPSHFGEAVQEGELARAERLVVEGLRQMGWSEADLKVRRKGEPRKVKLAGQLRSQTTMSLAWIAERLSMGSRGYLAWLLGSGERGKKARHPEPDEQRLLEI